MSTMQEKEEKGHGHTTAVDIVDAHGRRHTVDYSELNEADLALMQQFGYHQVFKREFGYLSTFSFAVSISGLFATVTTTFYYPILASGVSSAVWCWLIGGIGCMCIALSVSELISAMPTSGGVYFCISRLTPPKWSPVISWFVGWLNLLGQVAGVASSEYGSAQLLLAAVSMGSDFSYSPTTGETVGVMAGLTVLCGIVNSLNTAWMEKLTKTYVIFHAIVLLSCCVALLVMTPTKNSAEFALTYIPDESPSGWQPKGWSFLFGFLSVAWTMTDYDATAHICEEIRRPEVTAAWSISMAMLCTWLIGFLLNIVLAFTAGDPNELLASVMGQPVCQLFYNSLGKSGGLAFTVLAFIILQFVCFTAQQALSRTFFAFARDRLFGSGSRVFTMINSFTGTPLVSVWISTFFCIAINLIGLGSYAAISGVFNVTAIALDWSYILVIMCKMYWGNRDAALDGTGRSGTYFQPGPWNLGKFSFIVNAWAVIWTIFVTVIFLLPTIIPTTPLLFNWASAFLVLIILLASILWLVYGRIVYKGPITETKISEPAGNMTSEFLEKNGRESDSNGSQEMDRKI